MSATATAARVLAWAAEPAGPIPVGPLWDVSRLARPPGEVRDATSQLARRTAARLGTGAPPFGAQGRIGLGTVFLAAATGGRQQAGPAATLAQAIPPASIRRNAGEWYDLVARHGLVSAIVTALDGAGTDPAPAVSRDDSEESTREPLPELLLGVSPLTAVLYRPPLRALRSDTTGPAVTTALALLSRPRGRPVLAAGLADWLPLPHVLGWRTNLLTRLRLDHQDLVLDVYVMARTRFAADWDRSIAWAARQLRQRGAPDPLAIATLRFWAPLAAIDRDTSASQLRPLLSGYERALALVRTYQLDQAGAA